MNEAALHELLSGRQKGVAAHFVRGALSAVSHGYSTVMTLRNLAYNSRWLSVQRAPIPVISLGNITTGGTGKTPMAAWLANWLTEQGRRPGLLSRGYRSLATPANVSNEPGSVRPRALDESPSIAPIISQGNDEKLVLDRLCPGVPHLQQRDRVASAHRLATEAGCDVLILDDGFQHRRLARNLDLVLIDALQPWGYGHVLPRGLLREAKVNIRRADLVIITRADQCSDSDRTRLVDEIATLRGNRECVEIAFTPRRLLGLEGTIQPLDMLKERQSFAFCGIGNPDGFRKTLTSLGTLSDLKIFQDHYHYQSQDLQALASAARAARAEFVLTTLKDFVKIPLHAWTGPPLFAVEIGVTILKGNDLMIDRLRTAIRS